MIFEIWSFFFVLIGAFIYYVIKIFLNIRKYAAIPGPEPNGIVDFLIGDVRRFKNYTAKGLPYADLIYSEYFILTRVHMNQTFSIVQSSFRKFKSKTIKYRLLNEIVIVSKDPRVVKAVLCDQNCFKDKRIYQRIGFPFGERFSGKGLFSEVDFNKWKQQRVLYNPAFNQLVLKSFMKEFNAKVDTLMHYLRTVAENKVNKVTLFELFNRTALDVIASIAFDMNVDSINKPENSLHLKLPEAISGLQKYILDPFYAYNPFKKKEISKYRQIIKEIRQIGRETIKKRLEMVKKEEPLNNDILTSILKNYGNDELNIEEMIDQFVTFFVAGQETTSSILASAFLEIGKNPEVAAKLKDEIDKEIGSKAFIEYEDLKKIRYTLCVFKEALRLHPAVPGVARITADDIQLDDFVIPKGSTVDLSIYSSGRDEEFFPKPFSFKPERFLTENSQHIRNYTYYPFSLGPRNCIGQNFAQIQARIIIAKFVQNFDFELDENQSFEMLQTLSIRPKDGTKCFISLRK